MCKAAAIGALFLFSATFITSSQGVVEVLVRTTLDGLPVDTMVIATGEGATTTIAYSRADEPGPVTLPLAPGSYTLRVEHGAGFICPAVEKAITVSSDTTLELTISLQTTFSPAAEWGYYSADLHAHTTASWDGFTPPDQLATVQLAAGLDVGCITDHNTIDGHVQFAAAASVRGFPIILGQEITTWYGHWNALPLNGPVTYDHRKSPAQYFSEARAAGAELIQICHPTSLATGYFHLQGRTEYDPSFDLVEIYNGEFSDDDTRTIERLYALWNSGHRYVAVGVSDDHNWLDLSTRSGRARTYVHVPGELTAHGFLESLARGRAYATYGPHVNFSAQQGTARPGDAVRLASGETLHLVAELALVPRWEARALSRAQIVANGLVLKEFELSGDRATISWAGEPSADGWYAVRVLADDADQAHTNPIWVELAEE